MASGELFRSRAARLYVGKDKESALMQSGDFVLVLVKNAVTQLAAVLAMVGAVQWPVGKDCTVTRMGEARFSFSLPGPLFYILVLGSSFSAEDLHALERILEEYSTCLSRRQHPGSVIAAAGGEEHESLLPPCKEMAPSIVLSMSGKTSTDELSLQMLGILQRARRMSAIAKVFSKSLERGTIDPASHVKPMDAVAQEESRSTSLNVALAGVDAVAKIVEVVEMGGRTLLESSGSAVMTEHEPGSSVQGSSSEQSHGLNGLICSGWTLNKQGLLMLYRVITASMAVHSSGSSRSSSSSSSDLRRLLSSSLSSSSLSSKSPGNSPASHVCAGADVRGYDASLPLALPQPIASSAPPPVPPFMAYSSLGRVPVMPPPPPCPRPASVSAPLDSPLPSSFRLYKPRPTTQSMASSSLPPAPTPPPCLPRPPRFQSPQK